MYIVMMIEKKLQYTQFFPDKDWCFEMTSVTKQITVVWNDKCSKTQITMAWKGKCRKTLISMVWNGKCSKCSKA